MHSRACTSLSVSGSLQRLIKPSTSRSGCCHYSKLRERTAVLFPPAFCKIVSMKRRHRIWSFAAFPVSGVEHNVAQCRPHQGTRV